MLEVALLITMYCCTDPLQDGDTPLHDAAKGGNSVILKHLLSTPGIVDTCMKIQNKVSRS